MTLQGLIANPWPVLRVMMRDGTVKIDRQLNIDLMLLFREWNSTRISRFLDVAPRTVQRWLKAEDDPKRGAVPDDLRQKIADQAAIEKEHGFYDEMRDLLEDAREHGIDNEVLCAWLASFHKDYSGREIE